MEFTVGQEITHPKFGVGVVRTIFKNYAVGGRSIGVQFNNPQFNNLRLQFSECEFIELLKEQDPNGKNQHEPGAKLDLGKVRMGLVICGFSKALLEVGKVGTYGANKYSPRGWLNVPNGISRYKDAMFRHLLATDEVDKDTGLSHLAHAAWNALAVLELLLQEKEND